MKISSCEYRVGTASMFLAAVVVTLGRGLVGEGGLSFVFRHKTANENRRHRCC